ncbi:MmgE/PrpD family protein [Actinomadura madurae]|uniref:MmgE/PrpD family protein n=1 Tax=Actinomadura madurae TaxID=1993 RepID=UPI0020D25D96|nr:MmgE/PrpD family protein [Actinomadura madurae]MCQ0021125.1 MmgE/PrpD family protein [Actinomadura madurae]
MTGELALERFARELMSSRERRPGPSARRMAHRCLSDALACAAAGVLTPAYERARAAAGQLFGAGDATATVWFDAVPAPALQAAFLNSVAVSAHDLDDGHRAAAGHPGEAVIPVVIAEAESQGLPDVDVLHAIVAGYEAGRPHRRRARHLGPEHARHRALGRFRRRGGELLDRGGRSRDRRGRARARGVAVPATDRAGSAAGGRAEGGYSVGSHRPAWPRRGWPGGHPGPHLPP